MAPPVAQWPSGLWQNSPPAAPQAQAARETCLKTCSFATSREVLLLVALSAVGAQAKRESTNRFQPEEIAGLCIGFAVLSLTLGILIAVSCKMAARIRVLESHLNLLEV
ncbi:hypothetical protein PPROV_000043300 [Pycnococcus provasolii]|uniref:Uncharacterized protein n=1 Tax=Pycnococcus provasolii TaxID=41880 RepID=A0A830H3I0_9CHLO|nr:hypothetical protein PPROV_000043300 [Pycnococcus provasolii]